MFSLSFASFSKETWSMLSDLRTSDTLVNAKAQQKVPSSPCNSVTEEVKKVEPRVFTSRYDMCMGSRNWRVYEHLRISELSFLSCKSLPMDWLMINLGYPSPA